MNASQDFIFAARSLWKHKTFAATALTAVALGVGATTAIFSVVSGVILRPFPFSEQSRLVQIYSTPSERGDAVAWSDIEEFRTASSSFELITGYSIATRYLQTSEGPERVLTVDVERGFFSLLGVNPIVGHTFQTDDPLNAAIASESFWRRRFGGDPAAIGRTITLDGSIRTIVGVMPDSFQFPYTVASLRQVGESQRRTDLWVLREVAPGQPRRGRLSSTGRLKPGVTVGAAESELGTIMKRLEAQYPERIKGLGIRLVQLSDAVVSPPVRRSLFLLFAAAALVLLLACANVTNLCLVRVAGRSREIAARIAIGAPPSLLIRQFLTESILVAIIGGALGFTVAWWGTAQLLQKASVFIPRSHEVTVDWRVFVFSLGVCTLAAVAFGLVPALSAIRTDPLTLLNASSNNSTMNVHHRRLRDGLVVAQVALAFILGVGAMLLLRELGRLKQTDIGLVPGNVLTVHLGQQMTPGMDGRQFYDIAARVRQVPGVIEAGFTQMLPLQSSGWTANSSDFRLRGQAVSTAPLFTMELRYVTPGYFQALAIPLRRGRSFTDADTRDAPPVIVINETLARRQFGNEDPIGKQTSRGTIIGVIGDVRQVHLDRPTAPEVYYPIAQNWSQIAELGMSLVLKVDNTSETRINAIRSAIREVNPRLAVFSIKTMDRIVADSISDFTLYLTLMSGFAGLALFLASISTYGVISHLVASRTREFAVRIALGANPRHLSWLVLGYAIRVTVVGLGCGLPLIWLGRPLLRNLPVSVRGPDVATVLAVGFALAVVAVTACWLPARRAAATDPMSVLRDE
jgi:predicted permease